MKCNRCGLPVIPWMPREDNEIERVAASLGTICRLCFEKSLDEFACIKAYASDLRRTGRTDEEVDRLVRLKFDIPGGP